MLPLALGLSKGLCAYAIRARAPFDARLTVIFAVFAFCFVLERPVPGWPLPQGLTEAGAARLCLGDLVEGAREWVHLPQPRRRPARALATWSRAAAFSLPAAHAHACSSNPGPGPRVHRAPRAAGLGLALGFGLGRGSSLAVAMRMRLSRSRSSSSSARRRCGLPPG
jgi:hypothetical protein